MARSGRLDELIIQQVEHEFTSSHQYIAHAAYFDSVNMPQLAGVFYKHSLEERNHAMRFVQYLLNRSIKFTIPAISAERLVVVFDNPIHALEVAFEREKAVTRQIEAIADEARDASDFIAYQFIQWFLREQVEEEKLFGTILAVAKDEGGDMFRVESFIHREVEGAHAPGAPDIAGGSAYSTT